MKPNVILACLFLLMVPVFGHAGPGEPGVFQIKYISIPERKQIYCTESMLEDSVWCGSFHAANFTHLVYIGGVDPDVPDEVKAERIVELDAEIYHLRKYRDCTELKTLVLCVSESLFIQLSDALEFGSERYYKKAPELNVTRFIARYENILREWFPTLTIYVSCWEW